jgi:hypothetical protein
VLSGDEIERLLAATPTAYRPMIATGLYTGLRISRCSAGPSPPRHDASPQLRLEQMPMEGALAPTVDQHVRGRH